MMSQLILRLTVCLFMLLSHVQGIRKVCYYTNWTQYRPGQGKYIPANIDPYLCTHYVYAFATLLRNQIKAYEWNDLSTPWSKGMYAQFNDIKTLNPQVKTLLAVGGWNVGSGPFHAMVATPAGRQEFAHSAVQFCRDNNFDGIDIDWEYPANRGSPPEDRHHFTELLQTVRATFDLDSQNTRRPRLMLTVAVAAGKDKIDTAYDITAITGLLDFLSVMTYDLHGSWEDHTGHNSPLYSRAAERGNDTYLNLNSAAQYWVQLGAPREKLNIGVAFFARTFTLAGTDSSLGARVQGPGAAGTYTREKGYLSYTEICLMQQRGGHVVEIPEQRVRYITLNNQWAGYDDVQSLKEKACYIKDNHFGGVMVWALDCDDFAGSFCNQGRYPLLNALVNELNSPDRTNCVAPVVAPVTPPRPTFPTHTTAQIHPQTTRNPHVVQITKDFNCYGLVSDFYPSPNSCQEYVICANQVAFKVNCAGGLFYNPVTKYCDRPSNVQCHLSPPVTHAPHVTMTTRRPTTPTPATTSQTAWTAGSTADRFCQGQANGLYSKANSCTKYFRCYAQLGFEQECPKYEAFNPRIQACDFPYMVPGC